MIEEFSHTGIRLLAQEVIQEKELPNADTHFNNPIYGGIMATGRKSKNAKKTTKHA